MKWKFIGIVTADLKTSTNGVPVRTSARSLDSRLISACQEQLNLNIKMLSSHPTHLGDPLAWGRGTPPVAMQWKMARSPTLSNFYVKSKWTSEKTSDEGLTMFDRVKMVY